MVYKLVFFIPVDSTPKVLDHLFDTFDEERLVGVIGEYKRCAFVNKGTGQFCPGTKANPVIGQLGMMEYVEENRVEVRVDGEREDVKRVIEELKKVHPYEEVAYDVYVVEDF